MDSVPIFHIYIIAVEGELRRSILEAGGMLESNYESPDKVGWGRASRTDKGVHAAMNLISLKVKRLYYHHHRYFTNNIELKITV